MDASIPTLPFDVNLRLFGHTFPENKTWVPQVQIEPQPVIVLPCSVPLEPTYTTFLLRSFGPLPTAFKFIAPTKSQVVPTFNYTSDDEQVLYRNFVLKPMFGVFESHQIVVVQLQSGGNDDGKVYEETWYLHLNAQTGGLVPLWLKGFCQVPALEIGDSASVCFGQIQPGCQESVSVELRNKTLHCVR